MTTTPENVPETPCARHTLDLEHVPHTIYLGSTPVGYCPGVGDFTQAVQPPADPFAYLDDEDRS